MVRFIDENKEVYGVEPMCKVLPIAPSTYYAHKAQERDPRLRCRRWHTDAALSMEIARIWEGSHETYGARKVWHQLEREEIAAARCTVERLMRRAGMQGVVRGRRWQTTDSAAAQGSEYRDEVKRNFQAPRPNQLWVSDATYVRTSSGVMYAAFVIDAYARRIVGWSVSSFMDTRLVLDALEQALCSREVGKGLIHHSDRGSPYLSMDYNERLLRAGITQSVGRVGDSYDNALAETVIGLYKSELIRRLGTWNGKSSLECETLKWVDWYNNRRLLSSIGYRPPAEWEAMYYCREKESAVAA